MPFHPLAQTIEDVLKSRGVWYERFEHAEVRTSEEAQIVLPQYSLAEGVKSLIVRVKIPYSGKNFVLCAVTGDSRLDVKKAKAAIGASDLRFATAQEVNEITGGVKPGGIAPWGNMFDIETYADEGIFVHEKIVCNAGDRQVSIAILSRDYKDIVGPCVVSIV